MKMLQKALVILIIAMPNAASAYDFYSSNSGYSDKDAEYLKCAMVADEVMSPYEKSLSWVAEGSDREWFDVFANCMKMRGNANATEYY